jgi:hypothetical protein
MSLSIAVKNSILLLLVILILHFLIKNALTEKFTCNAPPPPSQSASSGGGGDDDAFITGAEANLTSRPAPVQLGAEALCGSGKVTDEDDLYKYVFGAECPDGAALIRSVTEDATKGGPVCTGKTRPESPAPTLQCSSGDKATGKTNNLEKSSTGSGPPAACKPTKTGDGGGFGDASGHMIVGHYNNEKSLNGGEVFDGLLGYDGRDSQFQELV